MLSACAAFGRLPERSFGFGGAPRPSACRSRFLNALVDLLSAYLALE
jgi:hypothetical protein